MSFVAPDPVAEFSLASPQMSALRALFLLALHHGVTLPPAEFPDLSPDGGFAPAMAAALGRAGLRTRIVSGAPWRKASGLGSAYPVLAEMRGGAWVILIHTLKGPQGEQAAILDPAAESEGIRLIAKADFLARWTGALLLARPTRPVQQANRSFGLAWFLPALLAQKGLLAGVATAVILGNLIGYALPLLFQVMIDKVIAHHAWNTLFAVVGVYVLLVTFDASFSYVRQRLMLVAGGRIDARIGASLHAQFMALPLAVFERSSAGVLARHMQLTEKVRHFLTGRLFQTLLDASLLPVLICLLALLSGPLTLVVLGFALTMAGLIAVLLPLLQRRLSVLYDAEATRQAHLVETLHNMRTVKSLVLEPVRRTLWEDSLAATIRAQWGVGGVGAVAMALTGLVERLMQVAVIGTGAALVLQGDLSVGTLVAFMMLAGRVTGPLVQIVSLIHEWQEARLAVHTLREVMDHPPEKGPEARLARPAMTGAISLDKVRFAYPGASSPALDQISLTIAPGQVVGIVGRSGSGKTTLTRLLQGIEVPQDGVIRIDGVDLRQIDLVHLRRKVGVVLQDNNLFRGTLAANIAAACPSAGPDAIAAAARMAGAEEFISRLPRGLETEVAEGGANLSGGQRQRIAIARALLMAPPVLILDEATSALDPESEAEVNRNLAAIARGRTVIVVTHRMSSLVRADMIVVLDRGRVLDAGPHAALLARCDTYRALWTQQSEHMQ